VTDTSQQWYGCMDLCILIIVLVISLKPEAHSPEDDNAEHDGELEHDGVHEGH
jgi:hypothetical protein